MNDENSTEKARNKGSGDPVQRAARDARIKQNLRANLQRRKQKARALKSPTPETQSNGSS